MPKFIFKILIYDGFLLSCVIVELQWNLLRENILLMAKLCISGVVSITKHIYRYLYLHADMQVHV